MNDMLTQQYLRRRLLYDQNTGVFTWKADLSNDRTNWNETFAGTRAGFVRGGGYRAIWLLGRQWAEHQLAWLYVHGCWPIECIDHRNGIRSDNRLGNLRACSRSENMHNPSLRSDNTSGYVGVTYAKAERKWVARIKLAGKRYNVGRFDDPKSAYQAYLTAKAALHPFNPVPRQSAKEARDGR